MSGYLEARRVMIEREKEATRKLRERVTVTITVKRRDVKVKVNRHGYGAKADQAERGEITRFSAASARRLVDLCRNARGLETVGCVTYPSDWPVDGREVKRHLSNLRKRLVRRGLGGVWFLEFQERGAPHFHFMLTGFLHYSELASMWSEIIGGGEETKKAGTRIEAIRNKDQGMGSYAAKYACKERQKVVPPGYRNVGRFWGVFGEVDRGEDYEYTSEQGGDIQPVVRCLRRAIGQSGGGRVGKVYRDMAGVGKRAAAYYLADHETGELKE